MARIAPACILAALLLGAGAAQSQNLLSGFSLRFSSGFDDISGLEDLNGYVEELNFYYGDDIDAAFANDAAGNSNFGGGVGNDPFGGWRPAFRMENFSVNNPFGIQLEKELRATDYTRVIGGIEYSVGNHDVASTYNFSVQGNIEGSIRAREQIDLSAIMLTGRFSLKDPNLPVYAHVGAGLGSASIESEGIETFAQTSLITSEFYEVHRIVMSHDQSTIAGKLFVGLELKLGRYSLMLDGGYNFMDFGELDGTTTTAMTNIATGESFVVEVEGAPDSRYDPLPLIRLLFNEQRTSRNPTGNPPAVVSFNNHREWWDDAPIGTPKAMEYNLSGGFAKVSVAIGF